MRIATKIRPPHHSYGFTILELMVAATVFSVILLVVAVGVIGFTNSYYKGVTSSKTQAAARDIMNAIAESVEFSKGAPSTLSGGGGAQGLCIDNTLYSYVIGQEVVDSSPSGAHQAYHGLIVSSAGCGAVNVPNSPAALPPTSRELLGSHMRLGVLSVQPAGTGGLYSIEVRVIYGEDDLLTPAVGGSTDWSQELCAGNSGGNQFCAVSDLTTTVQQRLL